MHDSLLISIALAIATLGIALLILVAPTTTIETTNTTLSGEITHITQMGSISTIDIGQCDTQRIVSFAQPRVQIGDRIKITGTTKNYPDASQIVAHTIKKVPS